MKALEGLGDRKIAFEKNFIFEVARKLHPLIKTSTEGLGNGFKQRLVEVFPIFRQFGGKFKVGWCHG